MDAAEQAYEAARAEIARVKANFGDTMFGDRSADDAPRQEISRTERGYGDPSSPGNNAHQIHGPLRPARWVEKRLLRPLRALAAIPDHQEPSSPRASSWVDWGVEAEPRHIVQHHRITNHLAPLAGIESGIRKPPSNLLNHSYARCTDLTPELKTLHTAEDRISSGLNYPKNTPAADHAAEDQATPKRHGAGSWSTPQDRTRQTLAYPAPAVPPLGPDPYTPAATPDCDSPPKPYLGVCQSGRRFKTAQTQNPASDP